MTQEEEKSNWAFEIKREKKTDTSFSNGRKKLRRYDKAKALAVFKKSIHFNETSELQREQISYRLEQSKADIQPVAEPFDKHRADIK